MLHERTIAHISRLSDAELLEYVYTGTRMYEQEAVDFAKKELARRKIPQKKVAELQPAILQKVTKFDAKNELDMPHRSCAPSLVCDACSREGPTKYVEYSQNIGAIYCRFRRIHRGWFCKQCNRSLFWKTSLITIVFGWWGIVSFFATILCLLNNFTTMIGSRSLQPIASTVRPPKLNASDAEKIAPHTTLITERLLTEGNSSDVARDVAKLAGVPPVQVWCFIVEMLKEQRAAASQRPTCGFPVDVAKQGA